MDDIIKVQTLKSFFSKHILISENHHTNYQMGNEIIFLIKLIQDKGNINVDLLI
jgi:hypothetical protein